jgi:hypothetical protein
MALKENVFTPNLIVVLDALTDITYAASLQEVVTNRAIEADSKTFKRQDLPLNAKFGSYFYGTILAVPDLFSSRNWEKQFITRQYERQNASEDDPHDLAREVEGRVHAQMICVIFEVMEIFLRQTGALLLFQTRTSSGVQKIPFPFSKKDFQSISRTKHAASSIEYFRDYMKWKYRAGYVPFLKDLTSKLPSVLSETRHSSAMKHLTEFYRAVEFVRHRAVHCNGTYSSQNLKALATDEQDAVRTMTRRSNLFKTDMILPTRDHTEAIARKMASLALFLHQCIGRDLGMKLNWPIR